MINEALPLAPSLPEPWQVGDSFYLLSMFSLQRQYIAHRLSLVVESGPLRLCNVSTSTQDHNSIPQLASAISLCSSNLRSLVPSAPNRPFLCAIFEAVLTIRRQVNMCQFTVVLPVSQSLVNQRTHSNQRRWWDLFGKRQPQGVVERLERNLESWGSRNKGDTSRVPDAFSPCNSTLFDSVTSFRTRRRRWDSGRCKSCRCSEGWNLREAQGRLSLTVGLGVSECGCTRA